MDDRLLELCAVAAHNVNQAYCAAIGDPPIPAWADTTEGLRESTRAGVRGILLGATRSPEQQHAAWMKTRLADGWVLGEVKDVEKKTHPNLVPYDMLPAAQRAKDSIFRAVVQEIARASRG